jgi:hypothetical protein
MVRILIALVLFAHGVGHSLGLLQVFKVATVNPEWQGDSWLLSGLVSNTAAQMVGVVVWVVAMVGFIISAAIVMGWLPATWFAPVAVVSAIASLVGLLLFPFAFPPFSSLGAFVVDVGVLIAVMWAHWVPSDLTA